MKLEAIVFDCDGVLADTERFGHLPAFNATFSHFGVPAQWTDDEYARLVEIGGGKERMSTLFDGVLAGTQWDGPAGVRRAHLEAWHAEKTTRYVELIASGLIPPRTGIARIVRSASDEGIALAVASTSAEASVRAVLRRAVGDDLAARFAVAAGDAVPMKKPAPDIYLHALAMLGVDPECAVAIEDSGIGCQSAIAAGIRAVVTPSAYTGRDDFSGAALVVSELGDPGSRRIEVIDDPLSITGDREVIDLETLRRLR